MKMRLLGGILLIVGTSIGGGMLALPIATAKLGFVHSSLLLLTCWFIMTTSAFLLLEINFWLPRNNNIISMAKATLGKPGQFIAWVSYLLVFYSLVAAYIAGGGDFLHGLLAYMGLQVSNTVASLLFLVVLGCIVLAGIHWIDHVNRSLMFIKLGAYVLLLFFIFPHVSKSLLSEGELASPGGAITVCLLSFGFSTIIPSLRLYFHENKALLHRAILIGSIIPLVCYILWDLAIMGIIPRTGPDGLITISEAGKSTSEFVNQINFILDKKFITDIAHAFTTVCLATAFLSVSLGLSDFLADGFSLEKNSKKNNVIIYGLTFVPPTVIALFYPHAFITALSYAGVFCMILMVLLPALMIWRGRYHLNIAKGGQVFGGKYLLVFLMMSSVGVIGYTVYSLVSGMF